MSGHVLYFLKTHHERKHNTGSIKAWKNDSTQVRNTVQIYVSVFSRYLNVPKKTVNGVHICEGCGLFCLHSTAFALHVDTERELPYSLARQCKQTCLLLHAALHSTNLNNVGRGDKNGEAHASVPSQRTATHGVPPVLLRKNYWRIPIKTGSSQGSETATTLRGGPLTLQRATRNPLAKRQKTDCCVTGWNKNTALPVSLGRRGAAVVGLHWRCLVFSGVRTQFLSI